MSKFLCVLCAVCCAFACVMCAVICMPVAVHAETSAGWVRVTNDNVCLYATAESSKILFQLPKSYYLRVLSEEGSLLLVSVMENETNFPQITGYVWLSEVEICDEAPETPYYPTERITVDADSAQLKLTPTPSSETIIVITNSQKMSYYGSVTSYGQTWYYVYFCGKFGYVSADNVTEPTIDLHPTPLSKDVEVIPDTTDTTTNADTDCQTDNETDNQASNIASDTEIVLIIFVALLALGICLALFLPGNLKKKGKFEDV